MSAAWLEFDDRPVVPYGAIGAPELPLGSFHAVLSAVMLFLESKSMRRLRCVVAAMALFSCGELATAATQSFTVSGTVLTADAGNLFGLNVGDPISLQATYDDTTVVGYMIPFDSSTGNLLSMTLGGITLTEQNDSGYLVDFPRLYMCSFTPAEVFGVDYIGVFGTNSAPADYFQISQATFVAVDAGGLAITGKWDLCPEPSTWILTAMAATGLVLQRVRRRS